MFTLDRTHIPSTGTPIGGGGGRPAVARVGLRVSEERVGPDGLLLPRDLDAPCRARRALRTAAADLLSQDTLDVAVLLVSELVTNAVIHSPLEAADPIVLEVLTGDGRLRVEVADSGCGFDPERPRPSGRDGGGRGLTLVDRLADRWGARTGATSPDGRFRVWFELDFGSARS